jgi:hypothetical protein
VRLEQHIRNDGRFDFIRRALGKARLRVGPDICVRPAVEGALFDAREIIGRKIVAESVALLNPGVEFSGGRNASVVGLRIPEANVVWPEPSGSKR